VDANRIKRLATLVLHFVTNERQFMGGSRIAVSELNSSSKENIKLIFVHEFSFMKCLVPASGLLEITYAAMTHVQGRVGNRLEAVRANILDLHHEHGL